VAVQGEIRIALYDRGRGRRLPLLIRPPARPVALAPVVIFSHGTGLDPTLYLYLAETWSRAGYFCIFPHHRGASERVNGPAYWRVRPGDISFIIDSLEEISSRVPGWRGKIDRSRIGIGGHSHGAYSALLLAGARLKSAGPLEERRARAFLALSPPGVKFLGLTARSFRSLRSPFFSLSGGKDIDRRFRKNASWRWDAFRMGKSDGKRFHAFLPEADHYGFYDRITIHEHDFTVPDPSCLKSIARMTCLYWDASLKKDSAALRKLRGLHGVHVR
jgi:hypothetical protein